MTPRAALLLVPALVVVIGCASKQDYAMLPRDRADDLLAKRYVFDGVVTMARNYMGWAASQPPDRHDLTITVERVVKGDPATETVELRALRPPTDAEKATLPNPYGALLGGTRFRVSFDRRRGERYAGLRLVALGNTPELDDGLARVRAEQRDRRKN